MKYHCFHFAERGRSLSAVILAMFVMVMGCATEPPTSNGHLIVQPKPIKSLFSVQANNPSSDSLYTIYPNPFSRATGDSVEFLQFAIADSSQVIVLIQNPLGDQVAMFEDSTLYAGTYSGKWNPVASDGSGLNPGIYFVTLHVTDTVNHTSFIDSQVLNILNN
jgi:hypothetical protein